MWQPPQCAASKARCQAAAWGGGLLEAAAGGPPAGRRVGLAAHAAAGPDRLLPAAAQVAYVPGCVEWVFDRHEAQAKLAVSDLSSGLVRVYDMRSGSSDPVQVGRGALLACALLAAWPLLRCAACTPAPLRHAAACAHPPAALAPSCAPGAPALPSRPTPLARFQPGTPPPAWPKPDPPAPLRPAPPGAGDAQGARHRDALQRRAPGGRQRGQPRLHRVLEQQQLQAPGRRGHLQVRGGKGCVGRGARGWAGVQAG
jgi:hypothetical protein